MEKKFEILNYDQLPKKIGFGANTGKLLIDWDKVDKGFIFKTNHHKYKYNEFVYQRKVNRYLYLLINNNERKILSDSFIKGKIGSLVGKINFDFVFEIGSPVIDDNRDLIIIDRKYINDKNGRNRRYYKYKCNKCGFECGEHYKKGEYKKELWIEEGSLAKGTGCSCCSNISILSNINSIKAIAPWMMDLGVSEEDAKRYSIYTAEKVIVTCPNCGHKKKVMVNKIYNRKSISCTCGDGFSRGHKYLKSVLTQLNLEFLENYKPEWCKIKYNNKTKRCEYDFLIKDIKLIIEVDGGFHRKDNSMSGQTKEESQYIDSEKDRLAKENGYQIIRIFYNDYYIKKEDIINSKLNDLVDLSKINWTKATEYSLTNLIKEICRYWNNKKDHETTRNLATIFNLTQATIIKYLKTGDREGWCRYDTKIETSKNAKNMCKYTVKRVEVSKNNSYIGIFESAPTIEKNSEELFGIYMKRSGIAAACRGEIKTYKGFTFKYVENN